MKALVAGGAGFIGSHVCRALLERGYDVVCLDNLLTGSLQNIDDICGRAGFEFVQADVCEAPDVDAGLVLHLASPASPVHYQRHPTATLEANSRGTRRLLDIAARHDARFLFTSTSEVYGDPAVHPQSEDYWGNVNPVGPRSCYDEAKRFGEAMTMAHRAESGVNAGIVRLFNTYGPGMALADGRVIPAFFGQALRGEPLTVFGDGTQTRSLCYVSDLVAGLVLVAEDRDAGGCVFNLGNPEEITMLGLAAMVNDVTGNAAGVCFHSLPVDDPYRRRPDITKVQERYGWAPCISLVEGLHLVEPYFRQALGRVEVLSGGGS